MKTYNDLNLFIMRHGESDGNIDHLNYPKVGDANINLTPLGWEQAFRAGEYLDAYLAQNNLGDLQRVWNSSLMRTEQTKTGLLMGYNRAIDPAQVRFNPALVEQSFGIYSYHVTDEDRDSFNPLIKEFYDKSREQQRFYTKFPMGESPLDVYMRCGDFIDTIMRDKEAGIHTIMAVTHGVTARALVMRFLHIDPALMDDFRNPGNGDIWHLKGNKETGYSLNKIYDGENDKAVSVDIKAQLDALAAKRREDIKKTIPRALRTAHKKKGVGYRP